MRIIPRTVLIGSLVTVLLAGAGGLALARDLPQAGPSDGPQVYRGGQELTIRAIPVILFDTSVLTATAPGAVTVHFINDDTFKGGGIPHNVAFYTDSTATTPLATGSVGAVCTAPCSNDVTFTLPAPGTYYFQCDVGPHRQTMFGDFVVTGGTEPPTATPSEPPPDGEATPTATSEGGVAAGTATPGATAVSGLPSTGQGGSAGGLWWPALLVAPLATAGLGLFVLRRFAR